MSDDSRVTPLHPLPERDPEWPHFDLDLAGFTTLVVDGTTWIAAAINLERNEQTPDELRLPGHTRVGLTRKQAVRMVKELVDLIASTDDPAPRPSAVEAIR
ncbi:hypothetical protein DEU31_3017 [Brachybacterium sp. AG952]|uniref:hypothetical protein n=1 Tax=Brachybacterium sp. AG952 TaxID=2183989 RepID=UPI00105EA755|nr:hypothetical protein [Brachybacterium sp. AG952]TDP76310.1 hypothetical protein DEU31_3017 [Brachybacterium sp. AG952]